MHMLTDPQIWIAFLTLLSLEIVLGIDNVIFIAILADKLPDDQRARARTLGLTLAMGIRILLLLGIAWIARLTTPLFALFGQEFSGRDLILIGGGLFLIAKSTFEIHESLEGEEHGAGGRGHATFGRVLAQILALDVVFSLDSVITAVGMTDHIPVMIAAVIGAVAVMLFFAGPIGDFVRRHPTVKMLALSFLILIGVSLLGEGFGFHIPKGYVYFAMAFSVLVEMLNLRLRRKAAPVALRQRMSAEEESR
ncbi:MAG: TerC family protein [Thermoanaerobaculia bacterium]